MRKLKLDIDALEVSTFTPAEQQGDIGTVQAHNYPTAYQSCDGASCAPNPSCGNTCYSCDASCYPFPCYSNGGPAFTCGCEAE